MNNGRVRIGFIGAGNNARAKHLPGFLAIPGVEVVAVCNRRRESAESVARDFGIPRVLDHWKEVVGLAAVDAICVGTWPYMHAEVTIAALRAGKHVLTEARMACDLAEARAMLDEANKHPALVAQIVPVPRTFPFDRTIREMVRAGAIGELREVCLTDTNGHYTDPLAPFRWRQDFELSGMNTLHLGLFYEMILRWLDDEPVWVAADAAVFTRQRTTESGDRREVGTPESLTVLGGYANGCRLIGHFSGVECGAPRAEIRLNGSEGALRLDCPKAELELWLARPHAPEEKIIPSPEKMGRWRVEEDFIESIREGKPVRLTDFESGVRYMRFTEAVWRSWNAEGARVRLASL